MSETPETAAPEAAATPAKKSRGKLFIILGVVILLLGGGGAAAYFTMGRAKAPESPEAAAKAAEEKAHEAAAHHRIIGFDPFVVNLADTQARRFLRINVQLVVVDAEGGEHAKDNEVTTVRLRAAILEQLTLQTAEQVSSAEGKAALKKTIAEHATEILKPLEVADVLFSDFVVQYDAPVNPYAGMLDVLCTVEVIVGTGTISVRDCLLLQRDSLIRLVESAGADLQLNVEGVAAATGEVVIEEDSTSLRISEVMRTPTAEAES